jgi:hypothetical protein
VVNGFKKDVTMSPHFSRSMEPTNADLYMDCDKTADLFYFAIYKSIKMRAPEKSS